ncbi:MAG: 4-methyl-5(B-hydroxyethyl)-thiazole monophosphate biosynthesis protein [Nitrosopumilus sp. D6]|nr:MAG: 4-methyl-5(B-hydroxyethyl)-thiazole monophosphate biosynthesis protein [Nitrosopumilus sp. D6]
MASIVFTIPSVLNPGGGEKKTEMSADSLLDAFAKISKIMGNDFERKVLEADGKPRHLINVYINGKNAKFTGGLEAQLHDGDEVYILPAVAGGSEDLSAEELDRFSRQVMLEEIGYNGQIKLKNAKVCVVGTGGLGNPIIVRLAAMGVGTLRIIDRDVIELSNLHRQIIFDADDVGKIKVEVAAKKLQKLNPECKIEALAVSINENTALEVVEGCDVIVDALDSVNARYALNKACVHFGIPFVTGAAVGVYGQAFTVIPKKTACYYCLFPSLNEDSMPTCSIEGVHPAILSIVGGIEVAETVKIILGKEPALSKKTLHIDLETLEFSSKETSIVPECPVCGTGRQEDVQQKELILEELCGRNRGKRTYSVTPGMAFDLDVAAVTITAKDRGFVVENQGDLGLSLRNDEISVSFMKRGSAVIVGSKDESDAVLLYKMLLGKEIAA